MFNIKALYPVLAIVIVTASTGNIQARQLQPNKPVAPAGLTLTGNLPAAPTGNVNYVRTWEAMGPITDPLALANATYQDARQTTQYVDGLGRPLQTVSRQITPQFKDLVAPVVYDKLGREVYKYLPYASGVNIGMFKNDPFNEQKAFMQLQYNDEQIYYEQTDFEASSLNRETKKMAAGNSWAGSGRGISQSYLTNTTDDVVRIWDIDYGSFPYNNIPYNPATPIYPAGELYKNVITDENGYLVIEFKDRRGLVVLKRVQSGDLPVPPPSLVADLVLPNAVNVSPVSGDFVASNSITLDIGFESAAPFSATIWTAVSNGAYDGFLSTYYVYDDFGSLRFVIPPKAVAQLLTNGWQFTANIVDELCFRYEYDERRRLTAKKIPGADWVYTVYDVRDRPVFVQDGNMRANGQWMATVYNGLNNVVMTGMMTGYPGNAMNLQTDVTAITGSAGESIVEGMRVNKYPVPGGGGITFTALTKTHYDDYRWTNRSFTAPLHMDAGNNAHPVALPAQEHKQTTGLVTGEQVRVLTDPNNLAAGNWLTTVNYYDDHGRLIQTNSETQKGTDVTTYMYDFTGNIICSYLNHTNTSGSPAGVRVRTSLEFDHAGRQLEVWKTINDDDDHKMLIVKNQYNELGQLIEKQLGHKKDQTNKHTTPKYDPLERLYYSYNIRGYLTGINKDYANGANTINGVKPWFGMELSYDKGFQLSQYNGNMAGTKWRSRGDDARRAFGYTYDKSNRLMGADFTQLDASGYIDHPVFNFDVQMGDGIDPGKAYDPNGNILAMQQYGLKLGHSQIIDNLEYNYLREGNKLAAVTDRALDASGTVGGNWNLGDFTDNNKNTPDYDYDVNGNMITDLNKNMTGAAITYNHLNLPWKVKVDGGSKGTITYTYDAAGVKLQKEVLEPNATVKYNNVDYTTDITTTTSYVGGIIYESKNYSNPALASKNYPEKQQLIGHEEGRIRYEVPEDISKAPYYEFDYFVKDHLGNVRMVLQEEYRNDIYQAGMEPANRGYEAALFGDKVNTTAATDPNNNWASKLNANTADGRVGPGVILKVMAGDKIKANTRYWYNSGMVDNTQPINLGPIITNLLAQLTPGVAGIVHGTTTGTVSSGMLQPGMQSLLNQQTQQPQTLPKAYLNWVLLDEEELKMADGSAIPVGTVSGSQYQLLQAGGGGEIEMKKNGYLYVFVSNESKSDVYFDDIRVEHIRGALLEETHYYPYGLTMAGISSKAVGVLENRKKFQEQELASKEFSDGSGLEMYEFKWRMHDPQTGRFWQVDPLAHKYEHNSTYAFSENKVIVHRELEGLESRDYIIGLFKKAVAAEVVNTGKQIDNTVKVFNKTETSTEVISDPNVKQSLGVSETTTWSTNFGGILGFIAYNNTNEGNTESWVKVKTKESAEVKTEFKGGPIAVTNKTSMSSDGTVSSENGVKVDVVIKGVPTTMAGTVTVSSNGQTTGKVEGTTNIKGSPVQAVGQVQYSTNGSQRGVSVGVGGQVKAGTTTVKSVWGFSVSW